MPTTNCPVCHSAMEGGLSGWHFKCAGCSYESSTLEPAINSNTSQELVDETKREHGLKTLRTKNFQTLLERIKTHHLVNRRLLEVGCAHGWFLEMAQRDFEAVGIEPDQHAQDILRKKKLPVRCGFFPQALEDGEKFDIIVFNDVIEHIPDIKATLDMCHRHLSENGLLVLNLPNSRGVFYQIAKILAKCSLLSSFERMWQKGLPSPHVHYFNALNLKSLLNQHAFEVKEEGVLPTLVLDGLYARISYAKGLGPVTKGFIYMVVSMALPVLKVLPGDIFYSVAQRKAG